MSESSSPRRTIRIRWLVALFVLLCLGWFVFQLFGPNSGIVVSKETTFITEPLGPDGLPDFKAHFISRASKGVTPENNAAVLIWQAMWPGELEQEHWLPMTHALGLKKIPSRQESLVPVYNQSVRKEIALGLAEHFSEGLDGKVTNKFLSEKWQKTLRNLLANKLIDHAMDRPWTSEQVPALARWAENNQGPLDLLVEASARPRYYSPSPSFLDGSDESLVAMLLPGVQGMRSSVRALKVRAMWHLGERRTAEAWQDLLACHRLARLATLQGNTLAEQLVAIAIDETACHGTVTLLHHGELAPDEARQILADLNALTKASSIKRSLAEGERLVFVDSVIRMALGKIDGQQLSGAGGGPMQVVRMVAIDWNFILREGNRWYDRFIAAFEKSTREERKAELQKLDAELAQLGKTATRPGVAISSFFSRRQRSKMLANILISLLLPALEATTHAEERAIATLDLTRVAAALAVYRADRGEYPGKLAALVPEIFPELPLDLYSGEPLVYERKDDGGYLLYSVFANGTDDGGTDMRGEIIDGEWPLPDSGGQPEDFDYDNSDLVIRVPTPAFELPEPPQDEE